MTLKTYKTRHLLQMYSQDDRDSLSPNNFIFKENMLLKMTQDADESFKALLVPKSLTYTLLVNPCSPQGHAGSNKIYSQIKRDFFWKGIHKDIYMFIQNHYL